MEQVVCKKCTSTDCRGCNLLRLEQMLESGKFDALMDEKHGIKTGIDVRSVVRARWQYKTITVPGGKGQTYAKWCCTACKGKAQKRTNFCPNCGAIMEESL